MAVYDVAVSKRAMGYSLSLEQAEHSPEGTTGTFAAMKGTVEEAIEAGRRQWKDICSVMPSEQLQWNGEPFDFADEDHVTRLRVHMEAM